MLDQRNHEKVLLMTDFCAIIVLECRNISNLWNVWECLDRLNVFAFVFLLDSISLFSQIDVTKEKPYINQNGFLFWYNKQGWYNAFFFLLTSYFWVVASSSYSSEYHMLNLAGRSIQDSVWTRSYIYFCKYRVTILNDAMFLFYYFCMIRLKIIDINAWKYQKLRFHKRFEWIL